MANTLNLGNGNWATKENSLLGYNSENGNYKPLPFDFTRASNGTFVNKSGLIETAASGVPRIDFLGNTNGALLLEPQRSNAITNSDSFGSTGWSFVTSGTAIAPIVTDDYAISPDGTQNAQRVQFNLGGGSPSRTVIRQSLSTQTDWFLSVWMKSTDGTEQKILWHSTSDTNETIVTGEWKRFTFSRNGLSNSWAGLCLNAGVSTVDTADILVYGFQAEQGSYATSLINTQGSAVTRVTDTLPIIELRSKNILGSVAFSYLFDFTHQGGGTFSGFFNEVDNTSSYKGGFVESGGLQYRTPIGGGNYYVNVKVPITSGDRVKCCVTLNGSTRKIYANGVLISTLNNCDILSNDIDGFIQYYGNTNANYESYRHNGLQVYNTELTNAEAIALTTI